MSRTLVFLAALAALAAPGPIFAAEEQAPVLAFVGRLISIQDGVDPCADDLKEAEEKGEELDCISMDSIYLARYEVLDVLAGSHEGQEISFQVADHYGFPDFAEYRTALLFVSRYPEGNWLQKYQGYPVHRISGDSWASCGDPYTAYGEKRSDRVRPLDFLDDLGIVGEFSREGLATRFFDDANLAIANDRIRCRQGIPVGDLYDMVRTGVMAARGITIPPLTDSPADEP